MSRAGSCPFENSTLIKYLHIWEMIIQNEKAADSIRQRISKKDNFDIREAFTQLDMNQDQTITLSEVRNKIDNPLVFVISCGSSCSRWTAT
jgi:hypothetical protein